MEANSNIVNTAHLHTDLQHRVSTVNKAINNPMAPQRQASNRMDNHHTVRHLLQVNTVNNPTANHHTVKPLHPNNTDNSKPYHHTTNMVNIVPNLVQTTHLHRRISTVNNLLPEVSGNKEVKLRLQAMASRDSSIRLLLVLGSMVRFLLRGLMDSRVNSILVVRDIQGKDIADSNNMGSKVAGTVDSRVGRLSQVGK